VTDSNLRDLERAWKESGSEEDCEAFLGAKVRAEGWPIRRVLELAMASLIDRKPTPAEVVLWLDTDCLPCNRCPNAASPALAYRPAEDRLCEECRMRRVLQTGEVQIIGGPRGTAPGEFGRRCIRRGCGQVVAAGRGDSLFCTTQCERRSVLNPLNPRGQTPMTPEQRASSHLMRIVPIPTGTPPPAITPPGTHGPDDYGPDSFGGSDF